MASRKHVHGLAEKRSLEIRLRKAVGQLKSVEQMVQDNRDCVDILNQVVSARRALKSFAEIIIHQHAHAKARKNFELCFLCWNATLNDY
jgi:DNA-binding FrmR family transcriptional regulator